MIARDLMTRRVTTVFPDMGLEELVELLRLHCVTGAPVVDEDGKIAGVVSQSDIARSVSEGVPLGRWMSFSHDLWPLETIHAMENADLRLRVSDIMNETIHEVGEDATLIEVADIMLNLRVHRVIVVDAQRRVKGVISTFDLVRYLRDLLNKETEALSELAPGID